MTGRRDALRRALAGASLLAAVAAFGAGGPAPSNAEAVKGVWILAGNSGTAIDSIAELEALRGTLDPALAMKGVRGLSLRVTWNSIHRDLALLDHGKRLADERGLAFSFRVLAGHRVPAAIFDEGSPWYLDPESRGRRVPTPFRADGSPNDVFERHYSAMLQRVTAWAHQNGVRLVHCPWYGLSWAELNHAAAVRQAPGYSYDRWYGAHVRLFDLAIRHADETLAIELPLSGGGPTGDTVADLADHAWAKLGPLSDRFFFQANGWGPGGYWGSPEPEMEMLKRRAFARPVLRGLQSIRQGAYDWRELFALLRQANATYCEIYADTLKFAGAEQLEREIGDFAAQVEREGAPRPPAGPPGPPHRRVPPATANAAALAGTWATQQVGGHKVGYGSAAEFDHLESRVIRPALRTPGVKGFSLRLPWFEIDRSYALVERGLALAREHQVEFSIRFMAGRYTPERLYEAGCRALVVDGNGSFNDRPGAAMKVPVPFNEDGSPNVIFEREYEKAVAKLAGWCRANGVRLLHLPWYGGLWDEVYHSREIRALPGYSYANWLEAHRRLLDLGLSQAGPSLAVEFPFSGHGPTADTGSELAAQVIARIGAVDDRFIFQANGWGPLGRWGSPDPEMEELKNRAFAFPVYRALQMIQPDDYPDWAGIYRRLHETSALYAEVYCPSFTGAHAGDLAREVARFAEHIRIHGPARPPAVLAGAH